MGYMLTYICIAVPLHHNSLLHIFLLTSLRFSLVPDVYIAVVI
jgi:hypothetical protein